MNFSMNLISGLKRLRWLLASHLWARIKLKSTASGPGDGRCVIEAHSSDIVSKQGELPTLGKSCVDPAEMKIRLMKCIKDAELSEQYEEISNLVDRAEKSNNKFDWNDVAMALFQIERFDQAISILDTLVKAYPEEDEIRLNLATTFSQVSQSGLCRLHLRHLSTHGSTEEFRKIGREQLEGYEQFLGITEADAELRKLQIAALREASAIDGCPPEDFLRLAKLLLHAADLDPNGGWREQSRVALEVGVSKYPEESTLLELLISIYLHSDPEKRLGEALRRLERLEPNSEVFEILAQLSSENSSIWSSDMSQRVDRLMQHVLGDDLAMREAALLELRGIVECYPQNTNYRMHYCFASMAIGNRDEAIQHAKTLDSVEQPSHSFHFNLGQVFYLCGDRVKGRIHLELAAKYANDEQERLDVWERIADLEKR